MPTLKQIKAAKLLKDSNSLGEAMRKAGYSEYTARMPGRLKKTQGWQQLVDQHLPDEKLVEKVAEGLEASKIVTSPTEPDKEVPDFLTRHKYVVTGLELKGKLSKASVNIQGDKVLVIPSTLADKYGTS